MSGIKTGVDYMPILLMLHHNQQQRGHCDDRFYLHFRHANRLVEMDDLEYMELQVSMMFCQHRGLKWLSWGFAPDARKAASNLCMAYRDAGAPIPTLDLIQVRLKVTQGVVSLDTDYLLDQPVYIENLI